MLVVLVLCASSAAAECVKCKPSGACFTCGPSGEGGCECQTAGCEDCLLTRACYNKQPCPSQATQDEPGIKVDEATILEVAQIHPRFAIALASMNRVGGLRGWTKYSAFPVRVTASDVTNWLKPFEETKNFRREYAGRRVAGAAIIEIEFTPTKLDDTSLSIDGKIIHGFPDDPPYTRLSIEFYSGKVVRWSVN